MSGATIIDGKAIADALLESVRHDVARLRGDGVLPGLAVVLVGDDPASHVYVRNKMLRAQQVGIRSIEHRLPADTVASDLLALVAELNADPDVHGILVQMPLPAPLDAAAVIDAIDPRKDVDGFHRDNVGGLALGQDALVPCTPSGCMHLLREIVGDLRGKHAVVVGRSNIVGKPMAALLLQSDCSVTTVHSRSANAAELCRQADIVVAAAGKPGLVDADWIKPGAVVVDVGINRIESGGATRLVGDVDHDSVARVAAALTPVPGGVGPLTIAFLMKNTALAARRQRAT
ncbi:MULTISPECIES: bifunctional 5,10-methylenetetrahydrofolate dehydrogenase/5,10-methenyltetrahydrofolate cyclohydrolase [unclassified Burkholderia]|uniref:bifunctional 5,10-methylenetetrahydrofolate dehydrogenase/5,10-methenyltetrahydrofolate cyclohydrolase n=1 Tax=unclassified Burkholderia TaxID=2613784 RepID=UPI000F55D173|nr:MULTISPECIES: bifunctional methylenetetrahydrofolate dehydrogenase/methenyltetrahydrofolate cyclohydrolase FolD [unclassified Burkholderia]RQR35171.1 bifunctional methylenetetrahydrofolate dehydrogenase/methenyltetrahydrofolate cyclohydrolase [Burkholderia sp. Bp9131]RQR69068.1 bifunctional methylenetetrahydrofolate dehydrogenase/methenyltetrahydrofolate cyclohydrolase [Burkholderia sp. Bp9015]RQR79010.1 bifunctional methylenetetrahydrofolate dehydrogenase/methenyltetrahydrofolate cyclohydrol